MKPWMMALIAGVARVLKTKGPFAANTPFIVPITTSRIESITGKGAAGVPTSYSYYTITAFYDIQTQVSTAYNFIGSFPGIAPEDFCGAFEPISDPNYDSYQVCHYHTQNSVFGAPTTAFGKTFPGGVGGPATAVTFTNVEVQSGSVQPLIIPSGGSISLITYYE